MKVRIRTESLSVLLIGVVAFLPYIETNMLNALFTVVVNENSYIPAICIVMLFMAMCFTIATKKIRPIIRYIDVKELLILGTYMLLSTLFVCVARGELDTTIIWVAVPVFYALVFYRFIVAKNVSWKAVVRSIVFCYGTYLIFCIVYNVVVIGFSFANGSINYRLYSTGGGQLSLAYTSTIFAYFLFMYRTFFSRKEQIILYSLYTMIALFTASRIAFWLIVALLPVYLLSNKSIIGKLSIPIFLVLLLLLNPIEWIAKLAPRLLNIGESGRFETWSNAIDVFSQGDIIQILFGRGIGNFFPYQYWMQHHSISDFYSANYNYFYYENKALLVQPHNVTIYVLLEGGMVGLFVAALYWVRCGYTAFKAHDFELIMFLFAVLALNQYDSLLIVQPGTAGLWWILVFIAMSKLKQGKIKQNDVALGCSEHKK